LSNFIERCKETLKSARCWNCNGEIFNQERDGLVVYGVQIPCETCGYATVIGKPYDVETFMENRKKEREVELVTNYKITAGTISGACIRGDCKCHTS
jgi:hypothetical protein